jgi:hypothetical protein
MTVATVHNYRRLGLQVVSFPECVYCRGSGLVTAADEPRQCPSCQLRRHDELSQSVVTCSSCGRSVREIDTVLYTGEQTHQTYRVCDTCRGRSS